MLIVWVAARSVSKKSARRSVESVSSIALVSIGSFLFIEARREREREETSPLPKIDSWIRANRVS